MEKNTLLICANESYQRAEQDLEALTGIKISHSTLQRLVGRCSFELPSSQLGVKEIALDGGKVRLRNQHKGESCFWKDYKAVCLNGVYCGAFFQENQTLLDWINSQRLLDTIWCIGDGHPGIWNLFQGMGEGAKRIEVLDWYHLKENLYKVGGSLRRLKQAESLLWQGLVDEALEFFSESPKKTAQSFCRYLKNHRQRIVNYQYYQEEKIASIGSGTVESAIKQIGRRLKLSGAQWKSDSVTKILSLRCAYLNGLLAA